MEPNRLNDGNAHGSRRPFWRLLAIAGALLLGASQLQAAGTIRGRVLNETTGEYLEGALIQVVGTDLSTSTDLEGGFRLSGVPEGSQRIRVSYLGLGNQTRSVEVSDAVVQTVDFTLAEDVVELEGVRVEATLTGRSAAINQQRVATGIKNIVNKDDFGQMNDGNLGMALRRMPGLSVDTDGGTEVPRYVNIRGFDASLNSVTMDGNRLASSESGSPNQRGRGTAYGGAARAFALDDVPADSITNVEIVKAPTPDMDGAALGGSVNLVTRTAFERNGRSIDYRVAGSYSELRDDYGYNAAVTYSDLFDAFGGDRNFGISVTVSQYDQSEGFDNRDYDWAVISPSDDTLDLSGIRPFEGAVNDYLAPQLAADRERTGQIAIMFNEDTEFNNYNIDRKRSGFSASFDLKLNESTELYFKPTYAKEDREETDLRHHLVMDSSDVTSVPGSPVSGFNHGDRADPLEQYVSLYADFEPAFDAGNYFAFREAAIAAGRADEEFAPGDAIGDLVFDPGALVRLGSDPARISTFRPDSSDTGVRTTYNPDGTARGHVRYEGDFQDIDIELYNLNLGGKTETPWGRMEYGVYLSENTKDSEEFEQEWQRRGFQFGYERAPGDIYAFEWVTENPVDRFVAPSQDAIDRFRDRDLEHKIFNSTEEYTGLNIDLEYDLARGDEFSGKIKGGVKYTMMDRSFDYDEREWDLSSDFPYADFLFENTMDPVFGEENFRIPFVPDARRIFQEALPSNPQWFSEQHRGNLIDSIEQDYVASEDTLALYAMGDLDFGKLELVFGARWEETQFDTANFVLDEDNLGVDPTTVNPEAFDERLAVSEVRTQDRTYDEFLPSVHLKYDFSEQLIGRLSVGRTYAKPAIKDMVGTTFIEEERDDTGELTEVSIDIPNFDLPTQTSENVDLSLEYYTEGGRIGAGYFRKDVTNFAWSETIETTDFPGYEGVQAIVTRPVPNTDAVNQGFEFFLDQSLGVFGDAFSAFSFSGNYTYTDSEAVYFTGRVAPTVGHSRVMYNLAVTYDRGPLTATVRWQYRDPFFENISISDFTESDAIPVEAQFLFDDVFMNPGTLDAEVGYRVNERFNLFANVTNITEGINASRQGFFAHPEDAYPHQRRWTFGLKGSF